MAKKSRRVRRQQTASPSYIPSPTPAPQPVATPGSGPAVAAAPAPRKQVDFSSEYRYVINDLRSMAVIALAMLVVLIALSFLIR